MVVLLHMALILAILGTWDLGLGDLGLLGTLYL